MSFLGWINFLVFQWFWVRLAFETDVKNRPTGKWRFIVMKPMSGWTFERRLDFVLQQFDKYYRFDGNVANPMKAHRYTRREANQMPFGIVVSYEKALEAYIRDLERKP